MNNKHIPRKRFGQHFLHDKNVLHNIVEAIHPLMDQPLVEIGPGLGALTETVLPATNHLYLIEIDRDLAQRIRETYSSSRITLYEEDALKFDFAQILNQVKKPLRIFGNLPYNISTPLLFHLLKYAEQIEDMHFMLQKEVVDRMVAEPGTADYGRLSVMVQYACQAQNLFDVPPGAFSPPPKVMSSVVRLLPYHGNQPHTQALDFEKFSLIVKTAFQSRRKTLRNGLLTILSDEDFQKANIDSKRRPETLSVEEFVRLSNL
jgi:16S rRNA (adenine1518-N6/adenine1519-N6)-dimethyltransferase